VESDRPAKGGRKERLLNAPGGGSGRPLEREKSEKKRKEHRNGQELPIAGESERNPVKKREGDHVARGFVEGAWGIQT